MATTVEKLQLAVNNKNDIKHALLNKGAEVSDNFSTYAGIIDDLNTVPANIKPGDFWNGLDFETLTNEDVMVKINDNVEVTTLEPGEYIVNNGSEFVAGTGFPTKNGDLLFVQDKNKTITSLEPKEVIYNNGATNVCEVLDEGDYLLYNGEELMKGYDFPTKTGDLILQGRESQGLITSLEDYEAIINNENGIPTRYYLSDRTVLYPTNVGGSYKHIMGFLNPGDYLVRNQDYEFELGYNFPTVKGDYIYQGSWSQGLRTGSFYECKLIHRSYGGYHIATHDGKLMHYFDSAIEE